MHLLAQNPLWVVLLVVNAALHIGFAVVIARLMKPSPPKTLPTDGASSDTTVSTGTE